MNVVVNGRFLGQPVTGVQRFGIELLRALDAQCTGQTRQHVTFTVLVPPSPVELPKFNSIKVIQVGGLRGHAWEQLELPVYSRRSLLLNLCNTGPAFLPGQISTIHDAAVFSVPETFSAGFRAWYRFLLPQLARVSARVLTVSEFSRDELKYYCAIPASKLNVVQESGEHVLRESSDGSTLVKHGLTPGRFVLAVSSMAPSKNFSRLVDAISLFKKPEFDVVIAGASSHKAFGPANLARNGRFKHIGYVSDGELRALYESAGCFVYPSLYEGFGLPPLEAMICGCPVIAARAASLVEICGDAALFCDPRSPSDIADKIALMMGDSHLREMYRQLGVKRAAMFSWRRAAKDVLAIVKDVLEERQQVR